MGLVRLLLQRLRPAAGRADGPPRFARSGGARPLGLPALVSRSDAWAEISTGTRLLDVFSVHYYPQGGEYGDDTSAAMQRRRNRSTRSLWDRNYIDESGSVRRTTGAASQELGGHLLSRYRGSESRSTTGAPRDTSTARRLRPTFSASSAAKGWTWQRAGSRPMPSTPTYKAMKLYRNYDGLGSSFGDISVSSVSPDPDALAVFAAQRATDSAVTVMAVNKVSSATMANIHLGNFAAGRSAQVWQLTSSNTIARIADATISSSTLTRQAARAKHHAVRRPHPVSDGRLRTL